MLQIRKIKTWYGLRYAVVDSFTYYKTNVDKSQKVSYTKTEEYMAVEYKSGDGIKTAVFELSDYGLQRAKEVLTAVRSGKKVQ